MRDSRWSSIVGALIFASALTACSGEPGQEPRSDGSGFELGGEFRLPEPCPDCGITLEPVVSLGTPDGPGMISSENVAVSRDPRGRYHVFDAYGGTVSVFGPDGHFLRTFGRPGDGPGEFRGLSSIQYGAGDSLYLFDRELTRVSVFGPEYEYVRSASMDVAPSARIARLPDGQIVVASSVQVGDLAGYPLHLLDAAGHMVHSFGSSSGGEFLPDLDYTRSVASAESEKVWVAHRYDYRIELWDPAAAMPELTLYREPPWFPDATGRAPAVGSHTAPMVTAIRVNRAGQLIVISRIPDADWKPDPPGQGHQIVTDAMGYYDTVIDVIDPWQRTVVASTALRTVPGFIDGDHMATVELDDSFSPVVRVWRIRVGS